MRDLHGEDVMNDRVDVCLHVGSKMITGLKKKKNDQKGKEEERFNGSEERKNKG